MRTANVLILAGAVLVMLGVLLRFVPGLFSWFGKLPGDIRYESDSTRVFIPITSMLLVSVALTVIVNLIAVLFRDR